MPSEEKRKMEWVDGALVRGTKGEIYFVPKEDLQAFRLPPDEKATVEQVVMKQDDPETLPHPDPKISLAVFGRVAQRPADSKRILKQFVRGDGATVIRAAHGRHGPRLG
jgi:hypothetical protein